MSDILITTISYVFGWIVIFVLLSWMMACLYLLLSRSFAKVKAEQAANAILMYGLLSPAAATVALIVLSFPNLAFSFVADHCHGQDCSPHTLQMTLSSVQGMVTVSVAVSLLTGIFIVMALQLSSSRSKLKMLSYLSEPTALPYKIVDSNSKLAWCAGLIKPEIFISRGLANKLTEEQMQIVLAHEFMHAKRKDNLRKWLLHWSSIVWTKHHRTRIKQDFSNYTEQVCDLAAVQALKGSNGFTAVMETLDTCDSHACETNAEQRNATRIQALKKECQSKSASIKPAIITRWTPVLSVSCLWIFAVILAVYLGHPLLEWVAV